MPTRLLASTLAALALTTAASHGVESTLQLQLSADGDFERRTIQYDCGNDTLVAATYINAAPNFLALVTVPEETQPLVFASVVSASGARYASGTWVWWTQGPDASLYDATLGEDAEPVLTCAEISNTP
jgi:membrane-bound inhibitor of C-type lysozyme